MKTSHFRAAAMSLELRSGIYYNRRPDGKIDRFWWSNESWSLIHEIVEDNLEVQVGERLHELRSKKGMREVKSYLRQRMLR